MVKTYKTAGHSIRMSRRFVLGTVVNKHMLPLSVYCLYTPDKQFFTRCLTPLSQSLLFQVQNICTQAIFKDPFKRLLMNNNRNF